MQNNFHELFPKGKVLLGMLHLAGEDLWEKSERMLGEARSYEEGGFNGVIVEDYHGGIEDVVFSLSALKKEGLKIPVGINILKNPYLAFYLANAYGARFIQFDTIQTSPTHSLNPKMFNEQKFRLLREKYPAICVLGGIRFKYVPPTGRSLEEDVKDGISKADAIVTTGEGTGIATPTQKLIDFRRVMGDFPLIVGAGVNDQNIIEQMNIANGAIIGSYVKGGDTEAIVQRDLIRKLVGLVRGSS